MIGRLRAGVWPLAAAATFIFWAAFATSIVSPVVVADEVLFLLTSAAGPRLAEAQALGAAVQPSGALAYPWLVHMVGGLAPRLETAAKLLNAALFTIGAVALALSSRSLETGRRSRLLVAAVLLAPLGTYTAYVMPEALYACLTGGAAVLLLGGLRRSDRGDAWRVAGAGALLAAALLAAAMVVKPHGLLALAALVVAVAARALLRRRLRAGAAETAAVSAAAALTFAVVKALTTPPGLLGQDLLGPAYRAQLAALTAGPAYWGAGMRLVFDYAVAELALLAPALVMLAAKVADLRPSAWEGAEGRARLAGLWALGLLAALTLAVPLVLATEADRRHLRYLNFLFPIVLAIAARLAGDAPLRTRRIAAGVWALAAVALAWRLGALRPLATDSPELFFLYGGKAFGAFGVGGFAPALLLLTVLAGAGALASGRVAWVPVQAAVWLVFAAVAIPNAWSFDQALSRSMAADRAVGRVALDACGKGPRDVTALGTPTDFVPVYAALARVGRPAPLILSKTPQAERARLPAGACLLTTLPTSEPRWEKLAESPLVRLYRAR